jgi:SAM-dependent methyltransferase
MKLTDVPTKLIRGDGGYLEAQPRPDSAELAAYYNDQYFSNQSANVTYQDTYTDEELAHKRLDAQELHAACPVEARTFLDVGCGEGFFLDEMRANGYEVQGLDFTLDGVRRFFPALVDRVRQGDLFQLLDAEARSGRRHDVISCNNVLEHVLDPAEMMRRLKAMLAPGGLLRVSVPNDDSYYNREVVRRGFAVPDFFKAYPDHLNYFGFDTFDKLVRGAGFDVVNRLGSFPISFFLFNNDSNYRRDRSLGKNCHWARVGIDLLIARQGLDKWTAFRKGCGEAGIGNDVIFFCRVPAG